MDSEVYTDDVGRRGVKCAVLGRRHSAAVRRRPTVANRVGAGRPTSRQRPVSLSLSLWHAIFADLI